MKNLKNWIMLSLFAVNAFACSAQNLDSDKDFQSLANSDTSKLATLTITKVKKPWYAWKGLVIRKMRKSIPEYSAIKGLKYKFYSFTEDHKYFGGVYLWESEQNANDWFNTAWYDRTEKKYGVKGIVMYYNILNIITIAVPPTNEGGFCAVLTYFSQSHSDSFSNSIGLYQIIKLQDSNNQICYLTLWQNKTSAKKHFTNISSKNEFFDVPILLKAK